MTPPEHLLISLAANLSPIRGGRHSACVTYRGNIIAAGTNSLKTHPLQAKYAKNEMSIFLHAEIAALIQATRFLTPEEFTQASLYSLRVKYSCDRRKLMLGNAHPCSGCMKALIDFGLKEVHYTTGNDELPWSSI